jgi:nucleotide-binding universal stress UspA family protein
MLQKILLATDGSTDASAATDMLLRLPLGTIEVRVLNVIELTIFEATDEPIDRQAEILVQQQAQQLSTKDWQVTTTIRRGNAAEQILEEAHEFGADLIVVGSRGLGPVRRFLLGSVSQKLVKYAECAVLLVRQSQGQTTAGSLNIVAGYDGSEPSRAALNAIKQMSLDEASQVRLVTVMTLIHLFGMDAVQESSPQWAQEKQAGQTGLDEVQTQLLDACPNVSTHLCEGKDVAQEICDEAKRQNADLILVGATGMSGIERYLLGSVSLKVVDHAPCSVWVARPKS